MGIVMKRQRKRQVKFIGDNNHDDSDSPSEYELITTLKRKPIEKIPKKKFRPNAEELELTAAEEGAKVAGCSQRSVTRPRRISKRQLQRREGLERHKNHVLYRRVKYRPQLRYQIERAMRPKMARCNRNYVVFFLTLFIVFLGLMIMILSCNNVITFFDELPSVRRFKFYQCNCPDGHFKAKQYMRCLKATDFASMSSNFDAKTNEEDDEEDVEEEEEE